MKFIQIVFVFATMLATLDNLQAQSFYNKRSRGFYQKANRRNVIPTIGTGTTHYYGDLAKANDHTNIKPSLSVGGRYRFQDRLLVGADLTWFWLIGNDAKDPVKEPRNLSFESQSLEANFTFQVQLFSETPFYLRKFANPYAYAGIGAMFFNPTAEIDGEKHALRPLQTEGKNYSPVTVTFPVGAGVRIRLNPYVNIGLDGGYRFLISDYIDDVSSGIYPAPSSFDNDLARRLSDRSGEVGQVPSYAERGYMVRGNPDSKDGFFIFNLKLEYYFKEIKSNTRSYGKRVKPYKPKNKPKYMMPKKRRRRM